MSALVAIPKGKSVTPFLIRYTTLNYQKLLPNQIVLDLRYLNDSHSVASLIKELWHQFRTIDEFISVEGLTSAVCSRPASVMSVEGSRNAKAQDINGGAVNRKHFCLVG